MAAIPHPWGAYAHLQNQLSETRSVPYGGALEAALNIIHQLDFTADQASEATLSRLAENAARQDRHRSALLRVEQAGALEAAAAARGNDAGDVYSGAYSLDDAVHARRELQKIANYLPDDDWSLLVDASTGEQYPVLAVRHASTAAALRSRVCRIRAALVARRPAP
jgi:hypothetical protein